MPQLVDVDSSLTRFDGGMAQQVARGHCSGILLDASHVLTAAHCVRDFLVQSDDLVGYTRVTNRTDGTSQGANHVYVHPDFPRGCIGVIPEAIANEWTRTDIAVIEVGQTPWGVATQLNTSPVPSSAQFVGSGSDSTGAYVWGSAMIDNVFQQDQILVGTPRGSALISSGDSGGPLVYATDHCQSGVSVYGMASGTFLRSDGTQGVKFSRVADPAAQNFINAARNGQLAPSEGTTAPQCCVVPSLGYAQTVSCEGSCSSNTQTCQSDGTWGACTCNDGGCGGDPCCGDPCCGDPCCGDPCCGDPCCGDPCCGDPCCGDPYCGDPCAYVVCNEGDECYNGQCYHTAVEDVTP